MEAHRKAGQNGKDHDSRVTDKKRFDNNFDNITWSVKDIDPIVSDSQLYTNFVDAEREAFEAINRCRTFEEAQACLKSNERGNNCPVCGLEQ